MTPGRRTNRPSPRCCSTTANWGCVHLYVKLVQQYGGMVREALRLHPTARQLLIDTLESGWTSADERKSIDFLKSL